MFKYIFLFSIISSAGFAASSEVEYSKEASKARISRIDERFKKYVDSYMKSYEEHLKETYAESLKINELVHDTVFPKSPMRAKHTSRKEKALTDYKEFLERLNAASLERALEKAYDFAHKRIEQEIKFGLI